MQAKKIDWPRRLGQIREAKGWSRRDLAKEIGSSPRTVEGWELGRYCPDRRARKALREIWKEVKGKEVKGHVAA